MRRAAWNTARSTYNIGADLCSGVSAPGEITEIEGDRKGKGSGGRIVITGTSTGLAGRSYIAYLRLGSGSSATFKPLGIGRISADGTFRYSYYAGAIRDVESYITVGSIRSATVKIDRN